MFSKITQRIIKKIVFSFIAKNPTHLFKYQGGENMSFVFQCGSETLLIELTKKCIGYLTIVSKTNHSSGYKRTLLVNHLDERDSTILKDVICNARDNNEFKTFLEERFKKNLWRKFKIF